jgi:ferritin
VTTQFQFLKECCDILQTSFLDNFIEKQHLVVRLNEAEKFMAARENEIRQQMNAMVDHLKVQNERHILVYSCGS